MRDSTSPIDLSSSPSEVLEDVTISGSARTYTLSVLVLAHTSLPLDHGQNISLFSIQLLVVAPTVAGRERLAQENTTSRGKFKIHALSQKILVSGIIIYHTIPENQKSVVLNWDHIFLKIRFKKKFETEPPQFLPSRLGLCVVLVLIGFVDSMEQKQRCFTFQP